MEGLVEALYGLAESVAGKNAGKFFPWVATIFMFVIISNWSGLIPGVGSIGFYHPTETHSEEAPVEGDDSHGFRWDGQLAMAGNSLILATRQRRSAGRAGSRQRASTANLCRCCARPAPT
jgi:F-type H+-transporting ATPase subunit a